MAATNPRRIMTHSQFWFAMYYSAATVPLFMNFVFMFMTRNAEADAREPAIAALRHQISMTFMLSFILLAGLGFVSAWYARRWAYYPPCPCAEPAPMAQPAS